MKTNPLVDLSSPVAGGASMNESDPLGLLSTEPRLSGSSPRKGKHPRRRRGSVAAEDDDDLPQKVRHRRKAHDGSKVADLVVSLDSDDELDCELLTSATGRQELPSATADHLRRRCLLSARQKERAQPTLLSAGSSSGSLTFSPCKKRSPQPQAAVDSAIDTRKSQVEPSTTTAAFATTRRGPDAASTSSINTTRGGVQAAAETVAASTTTRAGAASTSSRASSSTTRTRLNASQSAASVSAAQSAAAAALNSAYQARIASSASVLSAAQATARDALNSIYRDRVSESSVRASASSASRASVASASSASRAAVASASSASRAAASSAARASSSSAVAALQGQVSGALDSIASERYQSSLSAASAATAGTTTNSLPVTSSTTTGAAGVTTTGASSGASNGSDATSPSGTGTSAQTGATGTVQNATGGGDRMLAAKVLPAVIGGLVAILLLSLFVLWCTRRRKRRERAAAAGNRGTPTSSFGSAAGRAAAVRSPGMMSQRSDGGSLVTSPSVDGGERIYGDGPKTKWGRRSLVDVMAGAAAAIGIGGKNRQISQTSSFGESRNSLDESQFSHEKQGYHDGHYNDRNPPPLPTAAYGHDPFGGPTIIPVRGSSKHDANRESSALDSTTHESLVTDSAAYGSSDMEGLRESQETERGRYGGVAAYMGGRPNQYGQVRGGGYPDSASMTTTGSRQEPVNFGASESESGTASGEGSGSGSGEGNSALSTIGSPLATESVADSSTSGANTDTSTVSKKIGRALSPNRGEVAPASTIYSPSSRGSRGASFSGLGQLDASVAHGAGHGHGAAQQDRGKWW